MRAANDERAIASGDPTRSSRAKSRDVPRAQRERVSPALDTNGAGQDAAAGGGDAGGGDTGGGDTRIGEVRHGPERTCILSRVKGERGGLIRLALSPDGAVAPDIRARAPGRGAWIGVDQPTLAQAIAKGRLRGALQRAFKAKTVEVPDDLPARVEGALRRAFLDRLGLEARAGTLLTGSDRIDQAARAGQVHLLLHAGDAGADGNRKLDQALRVGRDDEGSDARGVALPLGRTILSVALGRENVVHIALIDRPAAGRVEHALERWRGFIGPNGGSAPCDGIAGALAADDVCEGKKVGHERHG